MANKIAVTEQPSVVRDSKELLEEILAELKVISLYLHDLGDGLDSPESLRNSIKEG